MSKKSQLSPQLEHPPPLEPFPLSITMPVSATRLFFVILHSLTICRNFSSATTRIAGRHSEDGAIWSATAVFIVNTRNGKSIPFSN